MAILRIGRITPNLLRINRVSIATVAQGGTRVDIDDPAVRRDLNATMGRWQIIAASLDQQIPAAETSTFSIGAESSNVINVSLQLKDIFGVNLKARRIVRCWLSDASTGLGLIATAPNGSITATTGTVIDESGDKKALTLVSNTSGLVAFDINESTNKAPFYVAVQMPDGKLLVSGAIDFA